MRCFKWCTSLFAVLALLTQISFAQNPSLGVANNLKLYEQGVVVNQDGIIEGQLVGIDGSPLTGIDLTIVGGDGFEVVIETDENGDFVLEGAEAGSYTAIVDINGKLSGLDFKVTASEPNISTLKASTGVNTRLQLVLVENDNLRFAAPRGNKPLADSASATAATDPCCPAPGMAGGGNFGGILGAAGLAAGIAALASGHGYGWMKPCPKPVTVGAYLRPQPQPQKPQK